MFPSESTGELYTFNSFIETLLDMAGGSVEGKYFYVGHGKTTNRNIRKRGMVNIAAFLAHARTNGFQNNACDEKNVDFVIPDGTVRKYAISNSCGQYGDSYQDMRCDADESFMECAPDPSMLISAVPSTDDTSYKKPPAFFCGPKGKLHMLHAYSPVYVAGFCSHLDVSLPQLISPIQVILKLNRLL